MTKLTFPKYAIASAFFLFLLGTSFNMANASETPTQDAKQESQEQAEPAKETQAVETENEGDTSDSASNAEGNEIIKSGGGFKLYRNPSKPPPKININFKKHYKKTDISERPKSTYKRNVFIKIDEDLDEEQLTEIIIEKCKDYLDDQKPYYFINLVSTKTNKGIKSSSCSNIEEQQKNSQE